MTVAMLSAYEEGRRRAEVVSVAEGNFKCLWKQTTTAVDPRS